MIKEESKREKQKQANILKSDDAVMGCSLYEDMNYWRINKGGTHFGLETDAADKN